MEEKDVMQVSSEIPGTAQIRKICAKMEPMELLRLSVRLAEEKLEKKLWSVLSRVYEEKKGFAGKKEEGMEECVKRILSSEIPAELKLQTYTSFEIPSDFVPASEMVRNLITACDKKRSNIAAYFIIAYHLENELYEMILKNVTMFSLVCNKLPETRVIDFFMNILRRETKECITGAIRFLGQQKVTFRHKDKKKTKELAELIFDSKEVFFTTKLLCCITFDIPLSFLPDKKELYKILKISINYEERITKNFVKKYGIDFDCSDEALCRYYLGNRKAANEKVLVVRFAQHLDRIQEEEVKRRLLRNAFQRGGYFRMYAGCMQDGAVNPEKLQKFHYTKEDIEWCSTLTGLNNTLC